MVTLSGDGSRDGSSSSIGRIGKDGIGSRSLRSSIGSSIGSSSSSIGSSSIGSSSSIGTRSLRSSSRIGSSSSIGSNKILSMAIPTRRTTFFYINVADVVATLLESVVFP